MVSHELNSGPTLVGVKFVLVPILSFPCFLVDLLLLKGEGWGQVVKKIERLSDFRVDPTA